MGLVGQNHTMKKFKQGEAWKEPQLQETKCVCSISRTMNIEKGGWQEVSEFRIGA